jgi:8-oxo-dGTP diphosphatase
VTTARYTLKGMAILRRGHQVLLVRQKRKQDREPNWALPGGKAEAGELPAEAMIREVAEEIGLNVNAPGALAYVETNVGPEQDDPEVTFAFEVGDWSGEIALHDPDRSVIDVRFVPIPDAISLLQINPYPWMRDPILAYLEGRAAPGALWQYRRSQDGRAEVVEFIGPG